MIQEFARVLKVGADYLYYLAGRVPSDVRSQPYTEKGGGIFCVFRRTARPGGKDKPVRYTKDMTGRFAMRPHYEPAELDKECEKILSTFFGGGIPTPIDTDSLARLIERDTSDSDRVLTLVAMVPTSKA